MPTLQIEHEVPSYEGWKKAFDSDPIDRKKSGVKSYRIYKVINETMTIIIELDFANMDDLNSTLASLKSLWNKVQGSVMVNPRTRVIDMIESKVI